MKQKYSPLYLKILCTHSYTWEDLDKKIYRKILKEEGYEKNEIRKEMDYLKKKTGTKRVHGNG